MKKDCCKSKSELILAKYPALQHARWITPEEIIIINEWNQTKRFEFEPVFELYNSIYTIKKEICNCPSVVLECLHNMVMQIGYQEIYSTE